MSESPALAADTPYKADRLVEIARMAERLTDRLLEDQIMGRPVSKDGIRALLEASSLLKDYRQTIPPLLNQIVQDFGDGEDSEPAKRIGEAELEEVERLARSLRPVQVPKGSKG